MKRTAHGHAGDREQKRKRVEAEEASSPEDVCTDQQDEREVPSVWTPEEDAYLLSDTCETAKCNWRAVCRHLNKQFKGRKRTSKDCQRRWAVLNRSKPTRTWSVNEELLLACALHIHGGLKATTDVLKGRSPADVQNHFKEQLTLVARIVKGQRLSDYLTASPLQKLQIQAYLCLLVNSPDYSEVEGDVGPPEVIAVTAEEGLSKDECLSFLSGIGLRTKAELNQRLDEAILELQNRTLRQDELPDDEGLRDILHSRVETPPAFEIGYYRVLAQPGQAGMLYLIGWLYPFDNPLPPE